MSGMVFGEIAQLDAVLASAERLGQMVNSAVTGAPLGARGAALMLVTSQGILTPEHSKLFLKFNELQCLVKQKVVVKESRGQWHNGS